MNREAIVAATLAAAEEEWRRDVRDRRDDPASLARIDEYIRGPRGLGWSWLRKPYQPGRGQFEWCGAFASWCLRAAGWHPQLALAYGSSTVRLAAYGRYRVATRASRGLLRVLVTAAAAAAYRPLEPLVGESLRVVELHDALGGRREFQVVDPEAAAADLPWLPEPGDIVLVGPLRRRDGAAPLAVGQHVTLCRGLVHAGGVTPAVLTVEGNGSGLGPGGPADRREGVVHGVRPFGAQVTDPFAYRIRAVIRPALTDFVPELQFV